MPADFHSSDMRLGIMNIYSEYIVSYIIYKNIQKKALDEILKKSTAMWLSLLNIRYIIIVIV